MLYYREEEFELPIDPEKEKLRLEFRALCNAVNERKLNHPEEFPNELRDFDFGKQVNLALYFGVNPMTIRRIMGGENLPGSELWVNMLRLFGNGFQTFLEKTPAFKKAEQDFDEHLQLILPSLSHREKLKPGPKPRAR